MTTRSTTFERSQMQIRTRFSISADGYVTTPDGWLALIADPSFISGQSHGFPEFQRACEAVLMGNTTFEPALTNDRWPWPDLDVFVLGADVPTAGAGADRRAGDRASSRRVRRPAPRT
jgi:hypothetical protein